MINSKKGISGIITAVIMIALVIAASAIVWSVVNNIVRDRLNEAGSCFDTFEKVKINGQYSCQDTVLNETHISIGVEDLDLSGILISISDRAGNSKSFTLRNKTALTENYLKYYGGTYGEPVFVPSKNEGKTYVIDTVKFGIGYPSLVQVAPINGEKQCEVSDTLQQIDNCKDLVS